LIGDLLKFSKGDYTAGQNGREIKAGTKLVANMASLKVGFVKWEDSRPVEHCMGRVVDGFKPLRRNELGDTDRELWSVDDNGSPRDPWAFTNTIEFAGIGDGELYTFSTSSKGGISAIGELSQNYGEEVDAHPHEWPVVELGVGSYAHSNKAFGRIKFPTLKIVGWHPKDSKTATAPF
jgi:hypothetical protein